MWTPFHYRRLVKARFLKRPNRFIVHARDETGCELRCFLPNPGKLRELLLPGAALLLGDTGREPDGLPDSPKTRYTVLAVERDGQPIMLHTHTSNTVAEHLLRGGLVPGLEKVKVLRREAAHGRSRFDFLMEEEGQPFFLEVKSVTLYGKGLAMFPDAVTDRGRRHLEELAELSTPGKPKPTVLFLIHTPFVEHFLPDYHTDLAFSQTLVACRERLRIIPLALSWTPRLRLRPTVKPLPIPWELLEQECHDQGAYVLVLELDKPAEMEVGALGNRSFPAGSYLYVGSAMQNLSARVERHLRRRKRFHWHVDYLRDQAARVQAFAIRGSRRRECEIAAWFADRFSQPIDGFGSSDCHCPSHLYYQESPFLENPLFHAGLERFRFDLEG